VPGDTEEEQREATKTTVKQLKSCVISPSKHRAEKWVPPAKIFDGNSGQSDIDRFCDSSDPEMLGLVARYDGVDLPGKACNVLILDGLPLGESLIDRFLDEAVKVETLRLGHTATRLVQAIGRIFRSNTDHGVVLLVGSTLHTWMRSVRNQKYLPSRLQQQIQLAVSLQKKIDAGEVTSHDLITGVLTGDSNWDATYKAYIDQIKPRSGDTESAWFVHVLETERNAYSLLWDGHPKRAADLYGEIVDKAATEDTRLSAWYRHLAGLAHLCADERPRAAYDFTTAANIRAELGRPSSKDLDLLSPTPATHAGSQAKTLAAKYRKKRAAMFEQCNQIESDLIYGPDTNKAEEAVRVLGELLGLTASRPDSTLGVGPDVLWIADTVPLAWGLELKTDKQPTTEYSKKEIGQCHNHETWIHDNYGADSRMSVLGRFSPVSRDANPSQELTVIELEAFRDIINRVRKVVESVDLNNQTGDLDIIFQTWLSHYGLLWPECLDALDSRDATDLKIER